LRERSVEIGVYDALGRRMGEWGPYLDVARGLERNQRVEASGI
jgi:hypothetical protein